MKWYRGGKTILVRSVCDRLGYSMNKAVRVVNALVRAMKTELGRGKEIDIPGLGVLKVVDSKKMDTVVISQGIRVRRRTKYKKTIKLKKPVSL